MTFHVYTFFKGNQQLLIEIYLNLGNTDEALDCAEQLGDNNVRNRCIVFHSLMKTEDLSKLQDDEKNEICGKLEKVYFALHDSHDKVLAGNAALMIGKVRSNQKFVQKAYGSFENCIPHENLAGELECMHWMTTNSGLNFQENIFKCILGMQTLFKALNILIRPINVSEREQLEDMLEYYGFQKSKKEDVFCVYPRQKPIALQTMCSVDKSKYVCKVKSSDACKGIFRYLSERGFFWKTKLENELMKVINDAFPFSSHDTIMQRLDKRIKCIELEMHIRVGCEELKRRGVFLDTELGPLGQVPYYAHCENILKDIFKENGKITFASMHADTIRSVLSGLRKPRNNYFHKAIESYVQYLIRCQVDQWKERHISGFLIFLFVHGVFGGRLQINPERTLEEIKKTVEYEIADSGTDHTDLKPLGFEVYESAEQKETISVSLICAKMVSCQSFLKSQHPIKAVLEFGMFCKELSQCEFDVLPCLSELLYWTEFYTTIFLISSTVLLSKPKDRKTVAIFLPGSYYENVLAMNFIFCENYNILQTIFNMQRVLKENESTYLAVLLSLSDLLYGGTNNLFDFVFPNKKDTRGHTNFCERMFVLCLVVFSNLRAKYVGAEEMEKTLALKLISLQKKKSTPVILRNELTKALSNEGGFDPSMFQILLNKVLCMKKDTFDSFQMFGKDQIVRNIFDLRRWRRKHFLNPETNIAMVTFVKSKKRNIRAKPKDISGFQNKGNNDTDLQSDISGKIFTSVNEHLVGASDMVSHEKKVESEKDANLISLDVNKPEYILTRLLKRLIFRKNVKHMVTNLKDIIAKEKDEDIEQMFKAQKESKLMCGICGVSYIKSGAEAGNETLDVESQNDKADFQSTNSDQKEDERIKSELPSQIPNIQNDRACSEEIENPFDLLRFKKPISKEPEDFEDHMKSYSHREKVQGYVCFRNKVSTTIYDDMRAVERFINMYDLRSETSNTLYADQFSFIDVLCTEYEKLEQYINETIESKDWTNMEVDNRLKAVQKTFIAVKNEVLKIAQEIKQVNDSIVIEL